MPADNGSGPMYESLSSSSSSVAPSSLLGFGAGLTLLDREIEIGRLLVEFLRHQRSTTLQAAMLLEGGESMENEPAAQQSASGNEPAGTEDTASDHSGDSVRRKHSIVGRIGSRDLPDSVEQDVRRIAREALGSGSRKTEHLFRVDPDAYPACAQEGLTTCAAVRLGTIETDFGIVVAGWTDEDRQTARDVSFLQMLSAQTSLAIHRTRLQRKQKRQEERLRRQREELQEARSVLERRVEKRTRRLREHAQRLSTLREIDQAILAAESPEEIARATLDHARDLVPFESATVAEINWDRDQVRVLATANNVLDGPTTLPLDQVYLSDRLRNGDAEVISDREYESVPHAAERIRNMGLHSILCLPMVVEGDVIGVVHIGRTERDAFLESEWEVGQQLADQMAIAIRQARLHERVRRHSERLEAKVQERTEELEAFTYSASHDLRGPLRAVDGFSKRLQDGYADQLDDEGRRLLGIVTESAQKMQRLIDDLLTLSRLGRHEMRRRRVDMQSLVHSVLNDLRRDEPERDITLTVEDLPDAHADPSLLRRVFDNLLSNALKFTRDVPQPQVKVGARRDDGTVLYYVQDNGAGFDPAYADKMFGVFERMHAEDEFSGTGVGLAIVERVVRRHDGRVWADGEPGNGATVSFCLSCRPSSPPDDGLKDGQGADH